MVQLKKEGRAFGLADPRGLFSKQKHRVTVRKSPRKRESLSAEAYLFSCRLREQTSPTPNMLKCDSLSNMCDAVCDISTFLESFSIAV